MPVTITDVVARDIRFPTSQDLSGSDAMNPDPDYSAAYAILKTDSPEGLEGHGLTFTIGRGNEICVAAIEAMAPPSGAGSRAIASSGGSGRRRASYTSPPPPSSTLSGTSTRRSRASSSGSSSST